MPNRNKKSRTFNNMREKRQIIDKQFGNRTMEN